MPTPEIAINRLKALLAEKQTSYTIRTVAELLNNRGMAVLLLLFSLPFAFPITIPGLSSPFGLLLFLISLRYIMGKPLWLPPKIYNKHISHKHLAFFVKTLEKFLHKCRHILRPRLYSLCHLRITTGVFIAIQSVFMMIPFPLPLTNTVASAPIVLSALGLLVSDGLFILLGYLSSLFAIAFFTALFWVGVDGIKRLFS